MHLTGLIVPVERLWEGDCGEQAPCLFVEGAANISPGRIALPPCPVIAIGEMASEWADAMVSDRDTAQRMLANIQRAPAAAAVIVELLRALPSLDMAQGLVAESLAYGLLQGSAEYARWLASRPLAGEPRSAGQVQCARDGDRLDIVLDRPLADNAINVVLRDGLAEALQLAVLDTSIDRIVVRSSGRSFSLGADLDEFGTTRDPATAHAIRRRTLPANWAARCADRMEVHIQGACVGAGLEIAAFARRVTASRRAWFQLPELAMGLLPGAGGCVSLTRRIGRQKTATLILSGERLSARQALDWGIVDALVDDSPRDEDGADIA